MITLLWSFCALMFFQAAPTPQLPEFYKTVHRVSWVVKDLDRVRSGWSRLGFPPATDEGEIELANLKGKGQPSASVVRVATTRLGDLEIDWIQPISGRNAYSDFLARHGEGIFGLVHQVATQAALSGELERLGQAGIGVLQDQQIDTGDGFIRMVYFDTESAGKYTLGLILYPGAPRVSPGANTGRAPFDRKNSQFAFVVRDPKPVSEFWQRAGFPAIAVTHGPLRDRIYRGQPGQFDHNLGWQRHGTVVYEWCIPLQGPTAYEDHLKAHGEGFHHLAFQVDDIDKVIADWTARGFPSIQSGAWGEAGKQGSGRFAYMDTDAIGGVTVELLWSFR